MWSTLVLVFVAGVVAGVLLAALVDLLVNYGMWGD